ncbi:hypothetical protein VARIO8X_20051 [Burkholderiales bacterium 8X]|nr:hypothetical protein VARIO8X_20051 [Burkholderiales bacterium 8X]
MGPQFRRRLDQRQLEDRRPVAAERPAGAEPAALAVGVQLLPAGLRAAVDLDRRQQAGRARVPDGQRDQRRRLHQLHAEPAAEKRQGRQRRVRRRAGAGARPGRPGAPAQPAHDRQPVVGRDRQRDRERAGHARRDSDQQRHGQAQSHLCRRAAGDGIAPVPDPEIRRRPCISSILQRIPVAHSSAAPGSWP